MAQVAEVGLGYAFVSGRSPAPIRNGPDGANGVVLVTDGAALGDKMLGYYPDDQTWQKIPGSVAWVGCYDDARPKPEDLLQPDTLGGHLVRLGDGKEWTVPVARGMSEEDGELRWSCALPTGVALDDDGNWLRGAPLAKYDRLWELACKWWDVWNAAAVGGEDGKAAEFAFDGLHDSAVLALQTNYRIGKAEAALLRLFDGSKAVEVLKAVIDWPTIVIWMAEQNAKKNDHPEADA